MLKWFSRIEGRLGDAQPDFEDLGAFWNGENMNKGAGKNEKLESMENVYQKLLERGFHAAIDEDNSFISVKTSEYTVCGDDDLITLKRNNSLFETSTHVLCSDEDELYNKIYEIFISYLEHPERFTFQKILSYF